MAVIDGAVRLFDCIEFNADFRILDTIGEIALLSMDLQERGHPGESQVTTPALPCWISTGVTMPLCVPRWIY
jgi:hypothetical protein